MSEYFRIVRGLEIDETVRYLQGAGKPGTSADTNAANVGSVYTDNQTGDLYTKIAPGSGLSTWQQAGTGSGGGAALDLYAEYSASPTPPLPMSSGWDPLRWVSSCRPSPGRTPLPTCLPAILSTNSAQSECSLGPPLGGRSSGC